MIRNFIVSIITRMDSDLNDAKENSDLFYRAEEGKMLWL